MTSRRLRDIQEQWRDHRGPNVDNMATLEVHAGDVATRMIVEDLLLEADGGATLDEVFREAFANGVLLPTFGLPPTTSVAALCASLPIFVDGFVAQVEAIDTLGRIATTPSAPRSAQGPDLIGALMTRPPLAVCTRARVRVASTTTMHKFALQYDSLESVASVLVDLALEGRAYSAVASGMQVEIIRSDPPKEYESLRIDAISLPGSGASFGGTMLAPFHVAPVLDALSRGDVVIVSPQLGRIGTLTEKTAPQALMDTQAAATMLHRALTAAGRNASW